MDKQSIISLMGNTLRDIDVSTLGLNSASHYKGKVRDVFTLKESDGDEKLLILTSDRISAFDKVLETIPCKGEVLNRISIFWFNKLKDIVPNHIIKQTSPRSVLAKKYKVLPIEVIVRGYLTGSAWRDYEKGNPVSGIKLKDGMKFNEKFPEPLITPSTKEEDGAHDLPISCKEIVEKGIVPQEIWKKVEEIAKKLFIRGTEILKKQGLILVDTKYEFGIKNNEVFLIDEVHTPDSSRFWYEDTYKELFDKGEKQRKLDKEYLRQWLISNKFMGDGPIPYIPDDVRAEVALRYIKAFELITGSEFVPKSKGAEEEAKTIAKSLTE